MKRQRKHPAWLVIEPVVYVGVGMFILFQYARGAIEAALEDA